ncbi:MAG TPA: sulfite exporter TauE/SafE family protein [Steroidobacteraceae bacterium]
MSNPLLYVLCGLMVGALVGLTGVGGGSLMTPILVLVFGQSPAVAVGTDLMFSASTKLVATASFGFSRRVDWRIVGRLALGSVPATAAVILWFWFDHRPPGVMDQLISRCLAVILALAAVAVLLQDPLRRLGLRFAAAWLSNAERHKIALTVAAGALLGAGVTMTSVGAGALGVAVLVALYPLRLPSDRLVATDIAHALPITAMAAAGHAFLGHVNLRVLACLLVGSIPGVILATRATIRLPPQLTRTLIAIMLAIVSERLFVS